MIKTFNDGSASAHAMASSCLLYTSFSYQEQREFDTIDADIAALEEKLASLEAEIEDSASQYARLGELMEEKEQTELALDQKMERWVYLNDLAEQISQE